MPKWIRRRPPDGILGRWPTRYGRRQQPERTTSLSQISRSGSPSFFAHSCLECCSRFWRGGRSRRSRSSNTRSRTSRRGGIRHAFMLTLTCPRDLEGHDRLLRVIVDTRGGVPHASRCFAVLSAEAWTGICLRRKTTLGSSRKLRYDEIGVDGPRACSMKLYSPKG